MRWQLSILLIFTAACAARPSNPVAISQPGDAQMSCEQLVAERTSNRRKAAALAGADEDVVTGNVAAGVASALVFWPAVFAMDLSNAEQIELRALQDRDRTLEGLQKQKNCPGAAAAASE